MVNYKKIDQMKELKEAQKRYKEFLKENDFGAVREYFEIALKAKIFPEHLGPNDSLYWGFFVDKYGNILWEQEDLHKAVYQYTFRRQPVIRNNPTVEQMDAKQQELLKRLREQGVIK